MGTISNRFFVSAISDGSTIHGSLTSNNSLVQMWGGAPIPNWATDPSSRPTITLSLLKGSTPTEPVSGTVHWYLNDTEITNGADYTITTTPHHTLTIKKNLATGPQSDSDVIKCTGKVEVGGANIDFTAEILVRITQMSGSGWLGVVSFPHGSDISKVWKSGDVVGSGSIIDLTPSLYKETSQVADGDYAVQWYFNGSTTPVRVVTTVPTDGHNYVIGKTLYVTEPDVTDYAVIECRFYDGPNISSASVATSEFVGVDDTQDVEYLWIFSKVNTGVSASASRQSLHSGQSATFDIWVAASDNSYDSTLASRYTSYKLTLLNSEGSIISGYNEKNITTTGKPGDSTKWSSNISYGHVVIDYDLANNNGGDLTGIVKAE